MSAGAAVLDNRTDLSVAERVRPGWILSPGADLSLLVLSPLAGLVIVLVTLGIPSNTYLATAALFLLAVPHYLSSYTFFMGDADRAYYATRKSAFWAGPLLVVAAVIGMRLAGLHHELVSVIFLWNIYHVAMQSAGILNVYRRLNGGPEPEARVARHGILAVNAAMAFSHIERMPPLHDILAAVHPYLPDALRWSALGAAILYGWRMVRSLLARRKAIGFPEGIFLLVSLLLFHPYLWVRNYDLATLGMLTGHFIQYLTLVWLLHRRRYGPGEGSRIQRSLSWVSSRLPVLLIVLAAAGTLMYGMEKLTRDTSARFAYVIVLNSLALTHFYLDGLIWAFKRKQVRESLGPYLTPEARRRRP